MKRLLITALAAGLTGTATVAAAADLGISINIAQPGLFGRIDIGAVPQPPPLIMTAPVVVERAPVGVVREPVYLHVPPGHEKHWAQHCREYNACGVPVYFVQDRWYNEVYVPRARVVREQREPVREGREPPREVREYRDEPRGKGRDKDREDRDDDHGNGRGHGHDD